MTERVYIAIDPGQKGALVALNDRTIVSHALMPMTAWGFDTKKLAQYILQIKKSFPNVLVVTEKLHAIFGVDANSTFKLGMAYQNVLSAAILSGCPILEVKPTEWTKEIWTNLTPIYKPLTKKQREKNAAIESGTAPKNVRASKQKFDSKKMSLQAVEKLFPNEKFYLNQNGTPQDGLIDALLIAEYARRKNL